MNPLRDASSLGSSGTALRDASSLGSSGTERAVPFHCPFCGETDLWPHEVVDAAGQVSSPHASWECRGCLRAFSLKMLGIVGPSRQQT